jgi:uncharacterized protein YdiU (UPF0061 family)
MPSLRRRGRAGAAVKAFANASTFIGRPSCGSSWAWTAGDKDDRALADDYLTLLSQHRIDFTLAFARLADAAQGNDTPLRALFGSRLRSAGALARPLARAHPRAVGTSRVTNSRPPCGAPTRSTSRATITSKRR